MNSEIFIMATIATIIVLLIVIVVKFFLKVDWKRYFLPILVMLPGSLIINMGLKDWIFLGLSKWTPSSNLILFLLYFPIWVLIVGITEELFKITPLLIPKVRKEIKESEFTKVQFGWSLGIGFGVGEIWYLAFLIAFEPVYEGIQWYLFTGFLLERTLVVFLHAGMTILTIYGITKGKIWLTIILGMIFHGIIDYIAVASTYISMIYILFILIGVITIPVIFLVFQVAQSNDKKKKWKETVPEGWEGEIEQDEEIKVRSLFTNSENEQEE